ncbi:hypothetical protein [Geomonas agri]|uniref:hypothetical protein n=1 Tax=Geomonas agri TaxID=2873702 RepID=UPI001CD6E183|nr:hypothetical protein [Geomonas agri]
MKRLSFKSLALLVICCLLSLIAGCGGNAGGNVGLGPSGSIRVALAWPAQGLAKTASAVPAGLTIVRVIVSAADMANPIQKDYTSASIAGDSVLINGVPVGDQRTVTVKGIDAAGNEAFQGTSALVSVAAGVTTDAGTVTLNTKGLSMNMMQTLSDQAQSTTLAFSALAMITGNLGAQTFFPPGKVADYTGFQYLRDNDPDNMGHNTSFLTRVAENVIYLLDDRQFNQLKELAVGQQSQIDQYGYQRFPLMAAFRRLVDNTPPGGTTTLSLDAVKGASRSLYLIDGQISYDRAVLYAVLFSTFNDSQKAYLANMKGKGWKSWPDTAVDPIRSAVDARMRTLPQGTAVAVMTYASDLYSWFNGSLEADVYFCPERHGTYYGSFFIKDAPAIGHEGYSINEQLTASAGRALSDSSAGYVDASQASIMSSLVDLQRNNLYAGSTSIVQLRREIAILLRSLIATGGTDDGLTVKKQVLALSATYGELDGENNYNYASAMARVSASLTDAQRAKLTQLRKMIMSGTYSDGTPFDFSSAALYYLYSTVIPDATAAPYLYDSSAFFH